MYKHYGTGSFGHFGNISGWLSLIFSWLFIAFLIALFIKLFSGNKQSVEKKTNDTPLDIIKRRYAKGEISKKEYEEMKSELKS